MVKSLLFSIIYKVGGQSEIQNYRLARTTL